MGALVRQEATRQGISLSDADVAAMSSYVGLLETWGKRIRLTGDARAEIIVERHLADVFATACLLREIDEYRAAAARTVYCLDAGSGAGLPGVPLAALEKALSVVSVEATQRKASFQRSAAHELGVAIDVRAARLSALIVDKPFALAMSRATWAPAEWLARAAPLVGAGGRVLVYAASVDATPPRHHDLVRAKTRAYALGDGAPRTIALYEKSAARRS